MLDPFLANINTYHYLLLFSDSFGLSANHLASNWLNSWLALCCYLNKLCVRVHMHVCIPPGSVLFNLLSGFVRVRCAICSLSYILLWLFWSKGTFLDYQKREIAQVSIFVAAVHLFTCCLFFFKQNAIKTFILSIFFLASCWNVKIVSVLNDWGGQTVSHIFL